MLQVKLLHITFISPQFLTFVKMMPHLITDEQADKFFFE